MTWYSAIIRNLDTGEYGLTDVLADNAGVASQNIIDYSQFDVHVELITQVGTDDNFDEWYCNITSVEEPNRRLSLWSTAKAELAKDKFIEDFTKDDALHGHDYNCLPY